MIRRHWGPSHEDSECLGEGLHGVVDLQLRHRDPLHPRQVVPVVARQQGRRDLGLLPDVVTAVAVVVVELGEDGAEQEGECASLRWKAPRMMRVERRSVILPITAVRHLTPFLGSRLGFLLSSVPGRSCRGAEAPSCDRRAPWARARRHLHLRAPPRRGPPQEHAGGGPRRALRGHPQVAAGGHRGELHKVQMWHDAAGPDPKFQYSLYLN